MVNKLEGRNLRSNWNSPQQISPHSYQCGFCDMVISTTAGWYNSAGAFLSVCSHCGGPTFWTGDLQVPGSRLGAEIQALPANIENLYNEIRSSIAANTYTGAVLLARKLLMHIAVEQGAKASRPFVEYVQYLADERWLPPNAKPWVDHIRTKGNEANHEIVLMSLDEAKELLVFSEMMLRFIYEFPNRVPRPAVSPQKP